MAALAHLLHAEQFSAVIEASKSKSRQEAVACGASPSSPAYLFRSPHFVMHAAALPSVKRQSLDRVQPVSIGVIIPKRWAKRAVTRNTLKRQFYAVAQTYAQPLDQGLSGCGLVLRQTTAFAREEFVSARSDQLKAAARAEIEQLFERLLARLQASPSSGVAKAGAAA